MMHSLVVNTKDLPAINYCWTWLCVEHISDITTSDGKPAHPSLVNNPIKQLSNQIPELEWPHQKCPNKGAWNKFYRAL
eukprot:525531-Ditylum_brightwellii.AAC.1